jgi:hypothetical protein
MIWSDITSVLWSSTPRPYSLGFADFFSVLIWALLLLWAQLALPERSLLKVSTMRRLVLVYQRNSLCGTECTARVHATSSMVSVISNSAKPAYAKPYGSGGL